MPSSENDFDQTLQTDPRYIRYSNSSTTEKPLLPDIESMDLSSEVMDNNSDSSINTKSNSFADISKST